MGHSSIKATERYAHLAPDALARYAAESTGITPSASPERGTEVTLSYPGGPLGAPAKVTETPIFPVLGRTGLEPVTDGLKAAPFPLKISSTYAPSGALWGSFRKHVGSLAAEMAHEMAAGHLDPAKATALAEALLKVAPAHLRAAAAILAEPESPFLEARAIELAEWVIDALHASAADPPEELAEPAKAASE